MKIWQIELTNRCNFSCVYCPRTELMKREIGVMSEDTMRQIAKICTSDKIRLHHYGESLLYPELCETAIKIFSEHNIKTGINTNGSAATVKNVKRVFDAGLDELIISWHPLDKRVNKNESTSVRYLQELIEHLPKPYLDRMELIRVVDPQEYDDAKKEMKQYSAIKCSIKRKRNLGQVFGIGSSKQTSCSFLNNTEFAVLWDGTIATCCEVYENKPDWTHGNVFGVLPKTNTGCSLCVGCEGYGNSEQETERTQIKKSTADELFE